MEFYFNTKFIQRGINEFFKLLYTKSGGDCIFAVEAPKIKFGRDSLLEIGDDANALGMKRVAVFTDRRG